MSQIFHRRMNTISRLSIFGAIFVLGFLAWAFAELDRGSYNTREHVAREQPVPFSHAHHVGGLGIDCRYCHTSVEDSAFAGIPPTKTCMNCHSVLFVDSQMLEPVRASFRTGIPLTWQEGSLQMEWCLDCHRDPAKQIRPRDAITVMGYQPPEAQEILGPKLMKEYNVLDVRTLTSCNTCHR